MPWCLIPSQNWLRNGVSLFPSIAVVSVVQVTRVSVGGLRKLGVLQLGRYKIWTLDSGLDSWTGLWTDIWTGFLADTELDNDHFLPCSNRSQVSVVSDGPL